MTAADVALWIWLAPIVIGCVAALAFAGGAATVEAYRAYQRGCARPSVWTWRAALRRWWSRNWSGIAVYAVIFGWVVGGFLVVVWLNGGSLDA